MYGLDAHRYRPLSAAQVHQESRWRAEARSPVGASGAAQFMPTTAAWICGKYADELPTGCDTLSPVWAFRALMLYDRDMLSRARGRTECDVWWAVLRWYNGGEGHWRKEARVASDPLDRRAVDAQCGRASRSVRHCAENVGYPERILTRWQPLYKTWGREVVCA